ncbi:MAG: bifunctional diaminohydroxyphosphoribosylaminopyrimidine deaminase/5-amino-6-(5-phosphoribosylamino)uracil reductase RibD [Gemmatimonadaceae bacterium]|nr:bifunctional diaminohydroxyphosphoribosylaminopyrimidine deaminase/5-amino-6-(5-phosphoribosylamino)uracil reductase RibD [Gemmatimonadaceae bacterium]
MTGDDGRFMLRALELARRGHGQVAPNPLVGAVVVRDGVVVGEGWHAQYGLEHAEVMALRAAGPLAQGSTVYVTLEPCNHHGKTPPCAEALLSAGVSRVVYAVADPNPVAAGGAARLAASGVRITEGVGAANAREENAPFLFAATRTDRPFVSLKLAVSVDGALVDASRARGWLTGPEARREVHRLRAQADAIAVGIGTAIADDPALTVREVPPPRVPPRRVVFDRHARLPLTSALAQTAHRVPVTVVTDGSNRAGEAILADAGVSVMRSPSLDEALRQLRAEGVRHLLVEGGATLGSAFLAAGLLDRLIIFQAPVILGAGALPAFAALPSRAAVSAPRMRIVARRELGADLMTTYAVSGD